MPSQASQLPQINESEGQGAGHRHLPRIAHGHKLRIHRGRVVGTVEQVFHVELELDLLPLKLGVVAGEHISHGVAGQLETVGRMQRRLGQAAGPNWALLPTAAGFIDPE